MVTVFYDGKCNLCAREITYYQRIAPANTFIWDDITQPQSQFMQLGYHQRDGLLRLHALDDANCLHIGVDAFALIWRQLPRWRWLAHIVSLPVIHTVAQWLYHGFAKWRFKRLKHCQIGSSE